MVLVSTSCRMDTPAGEEEGGGGHARGPQPMCEAASQGRGRSATGIGGRAGGYSYWWRGRAGAGGGGGTQEHGQHGCRGGKEPCTSRLKHTGTWSPVLNRAQAGLEGTSTMPPSGYAWGWLLGHGGGTQQANLPCLLVRRSTWGRPQALPCPARRHSLVPVSSISSPPSSSKAPANTTDAEDYTDALG